MEATEEAPPTQQGKKEKRFQCPNCQRAFARLEHLQRHERIRELNYENLRLALTDIKTAAKSLSVAHNVTIRSHAGMACLLRYSYVSIAHVWKK
jgi:hypothetical protein